jgi:hypothetical protein
MSANGMEGLVVDERIEMDHGQLVVYTSGAAQFERDEGASTFLTPTEVRLLVESVTTESNYEEVYRHLDNPDSNRSD